MRRSQGRAILFLVTVLLTACGGSNKPSESTPMGPLEVSKPSSPQFVDVTAVSGIQFTVGFSVRDPEIPLIAGGVGAGDYDGDGDVDLFVVRGNLGPNLLYRNLGNNVFEDVAMVAGLAYTESPIENYRSSGPTFADIDGDGDLDLFLCGLQGDPSLIFENNGDGTFTDVTAGSGIDLMESHDSISAAFGDYDLDGDIDLFVSHWNTNHSFSNPGDTEHLWRNDSDSNGIRFTSISEDAGISPSIYTNPDPLTEKENTDYTFAPTFARINDDLFPDILSVADFNFSQVFMNNRDGTFANATDVSVITDTNGMGSAVADYDNDGDLDWFVTSIYAPDSDISATGNRLYRNDNGEFFDATGEANVVDGGWGWAACFADLDNDSNLDIYHTNGWPIVGERGDFTRDTSRAFISDGRGGFEDQAAQLGLDDEEQGRGVVCADFDNDGDIDIFLWHQNQTNSGSLFRNDTAGNNYLSVRLVGLPPNTQAAGARLWATAGSVTQMREIVIGSNFISQNPTTQIFGLGTAALIDELRIEWPDGRTSSLGITAAGQHIVVTHPDLPQ